MTAITLAQTGWWKANLQSFTAEDQVAAFAASTLADRNIHYKALIEAVHDAATALSIPRPLLQLLDYLFDQVREIDWKDGRPICFPSNETIAKHFRQTVSAIKKKLRQLADLGLISRSGDSNGRRFGGRIGSGPRKGHLREETTGINLAPLAMLYQDHVDAAAQYELQCRQSSLAARQCRVHARHIRQLAHQCRAMGIAQHLWATTTDDAERLDRHIQPLNLANATAELEAIAAELESCRARLTALVREALEASAQNEKRPHGGEISTQLPSTTPLTFSEGVNAPQSGSSGEAGASNSNACEEEEQHETTYTQHGPIKATELAYLFPALEEHIPEIRAMRSWEAISRAFSERAASLIGLKQERWAETYGQLPLGYPAIMFAIALQWITDNPERAAERHGAGGGYFVGMARKYDAGELNLHPTIMKRRKMLEATPS